jgi:hypothetical protein
MFKGTVAAATFAIMLTGAALTHSADAAVCRNLYLGQWDAIPVSYDMFGNCVSRLGWVGIITAY